MPGLIDKLWRATPHGGAKRPLTPGIEAKVVRRIEALAGNIVFNANYRARYKDKDISLEAKYISEAVSGFKKPIVDLIIEFKDKLDMRHVAYKKFISAIETKIFEDTVLK